MVMTLEKVSGEPTNESTSCLSPSLVAAASLIIVAVVVGGLLILTVNFLMIGIVTYDLEPANSLINAGVDSHGFY